MVAPNLILNILTFNHPFETADVSFYTEKADGLFSIHKAEWPVNIADYFPKLNNNTEHLYVKFEPGPDDQKLTVNLHKSPRFAKHYYEWLISVYFRGKASVSRPNFVKDNEFWFWDKAASIGQFFIFKKFVIKVQINRIVDSPELVISYEGISKVYKLGLNNINAPVEAIRKVLYNRLLIPYDKLPDEAKLDLSKVRPVLSNSLRSAMGLPWEPNKTANKLKNFFKEITWFVNTYLNTPEFKAVIPITSENFIQVPKERIYNTTKDSNLLIFGDNKTDLSPFWGMVKNGPFKPTPLNRIEFILIFHDKDRTTAEKLISWLDGKENTRSKSLKVFLRMNYFLDIKKSIVFQNLDNPMPEIQQQLENWPRIPGTRYLGIYLTPFPKETIDKDIHSLYYKIKYELLKYNISSQVIETETILHPTFNFSLPNIAIAILAKLEGVPWRLERAIYNELIVGVGAFKQRNMASRYIGSSFCFSNDGHFQSFNCYSAHSSTMLAGSIRDAVETFVEQNNTVKRLVIHFYKRMSRKDLKPILQVLHSLNLDIPVIVININKTESRDLVIFDKACPSNNMIPNSGTFVNIGRNQFLLCNNTRYGDAMPGSRDGYPFPVKLHIKSTDEKLLEDNKLINDLIDQVYQFSRMYWTSVTQQNLPVTVKYPEMVAEKYPHFESNNIPDFGKENLWFL
ncbi:MAG: Piwi domain-containing protein [Bacteroidota bacterium]